MNAGQEPPPPAISVIVPTLNEVHALGATLAALDQIRGCIEVIVVDGGSKDGTQNIASAHDARLVNAECGRGCQMDAGARLARGEVLWFVHADTLVPEDAAIQIIEALGDAKVVGGHFVVRFDGVSQAARFLTWLYPYLRWLGLCYGDSTMFVRREVYERAGGFQPFPIFEDLDLLRRLWRRGRMVRMPATVVTSSRRFEGRSFGLTFLRWAALQLAYWLGVSPHTLGRLYAPIRGY